MKKEDDMGLIVPYPKINISSLTHLYNDHALISSKVTVMRDINTPTSIFRTLVEEITMLMAADALKNLELQETKITTPICNTTGVKVAGKKLVLVPILRAGFAMEPAMKHIVPNSRTGMCGVYRDKDTCEPVEYFWKMPKDIENRDVFVLDPMLATGGSMNYTISKLKRIGCKSIRVMSIIAAPRGIDLIQTLHPEVEMYIAHLDEGLNRYNYIVPGLGDAGDRIFGTK